MPLKFCGDIRYAMKNGEITLNVLVDFSKVFNTVKYTSLMTTLHGVGFLKCFMKHLTDYLTDQQQFVQIEDKKSAFREVLVNAPHNKNHSTKTLLNDEMFTRSRTLVNPSRDYPLRRSLV